MNTLIEILTLLMVCWLLIDRYHGQKIHKSSTGSQKEKPTKASQIMGASKHPKRQIPPTKAKEDRKTKWLENPDIFARESPEKEGRSAIPTEEHDTVFSATPPIDKKEATLDLRREEEDLEQYRSPEEDQDFATGLTFEELQRLPSLLRKNVSSEVPSEKAVSIAVKVADTNLLEQLEQEIPEAREQISALLDTYLNQQMDTVKTMESWKDFDISDFV